MAFNFPGSTVEQLDTYAQAPAHPVAVTGKPWTELQGWDGCLDADGFIKGTTDEEKAEIREIVAKGMACIAAQAAAGRVFGKDEKPAKREKAAKAEKPAKVKVAKAVKAAATKGQRVSKYGVHVDGTVQFVPARKIYHGWMGGKIVAVSAKVEAVKTKLREAGAADFVEVVFVE